MARLSADEMEAYYPRLYRASLRMVCNHSDAADLTQQAILKAVRAWDSFDGRASRATWLHGILLNTVRDWSRKRAVRLAVPLGEWSDGIADGQAQRPVDKMQRDEELAALQDALQQMPETLRGALMLTVFDGHSYRSAAELLDVRPGTVSSRLCQARRWLRKKANSHPKCNRALMEHLGWGSVVEALSGSVVQLPDIPG